MPMRNLRSGYSFLLAAGMIAAVLFVESTPCAAGELSVAGGKQYVRTYRVYGSDDRQRVNDTNSPPFSCVGMVSANWGPEAGYTARTGTGVLIGDRVVLTCAHVVIDSQVGWARSISFSPGKNGYREPFGSIPVIQSATHQQWITGQDDNYDICLLLLNSPIGSQAGTMKVVAQNSSFFNGAQLNITGYPGDLGWDEMFNGAGQAFGTDGNLIQHYLDGGPGQSGAPMWFQDQAGAYITTGVYTGDVDVLEENRVVESYSIGVRITDEFCQWINDFLAEHDPSAQGRCENNTAADPGPAALCGNGVGVMVPMALLSLAIARRRARM